MKAEIIEGWAGLASLEPEWNALLGRSRADCPFLTFEWIDAWRAAVGDAARPFVVVVRDGTGALAGIAPLYQARLELGRLFSYRALRVLGDHPTGSEYLDWIVAADREQEASLAIARALAEAGGRWDCLWVPNVSGWTGARERIALACAAAGLHCRERPIEFSAVALPGDHQSFLGMLPATRRQQLRRETRKLLGRPDVSVERCESEEQRRALLDALFELNHRRWSANGGAGTFVRKPLEARFYQEFTPKALERGWLRLYAIRIGGAVKAVQIGYLYGRTFYVLQEGFDPDAPPGTGNVLRGQVIERCIEEGVETYDFLGEFTEHKRRWRATPRTGHDLFIARPGGWKNRLLIAAGVWPTGRYLRPSGSLEQAA